MAAAICSAALFLPVEISRSSRDDFDKYAEVSGDDGWSWGAIEPYYRKIEHFVPPVDHHNTSGEIDIAIHGTRGPLNITTANAPYPIDSHINATSQELNDQYPYNRDMNCGNPLGIGWTQGTYGNGIRSKIAQSDASPVLFIEASKEVILSAGAINTPQLLLLSGIGPPSPLAALGIEQTVNLSAVGQHVADHLLVANQFAVAAPQDLLEAIRRNETLFNDLLSEWERNKQGAMSNGPSNHIGWLRVPEDEQDWTAGEDPSAGPTSPHYELLFVLKKVVRRSCRGQPGFASTLVAPPATGYFMTIFTVLVSPSSSGSVTLASSSPFDPPLIDPAFLNTTFDTQVMRTAIRSAARFVSAHAWDGFVTGQGASFADVDLGSDEAVDAWVRSQASTVWHPTWTATRMGRCGDKDSVVDSDLRVKGTTGLRVVDASVLVRIDCWS
ncbi:hypothetical protein V8D89_010771 [Ganoderma adspersum]